LKITITYFLTALCFVITLSCSYTSNRVKAGLLNNVIDTDVFSRFVSFDVTADSTSVVYSDEITLSIKKAIFHNNEWQYNFIDRVDIAERINPVMGKHFVSISNNKESMYYLDYQNEKKSVFKVITKNKGDANNNYALNVLNIECNDFAFVEGLPNHLFYINENVNAVEISENNAMVQYLFDSSEFETITDFTVTKTLDYISMVYKDINQTLYILRLKKVDGSMVIESRKVISEQVSLFDTVSVHQDVGVIYYDVNSLVNYYESGTVTRIGYYPYCSKVHVGFTGENVFFLLSAVEETKEQSDIYGLNIVYTINGNTKKWYEERLFDSEIPFSAIESSVFNDSLYIISSGINLTLSKFSLDCF